jgi:hypothetical protein
MMLGKHASRTIQASHVKYDFRAASNRFKGCRFVAHRKISTATP